MCKALYVITKENGQVPFPTDRRKWRRQGGNRPVSLQKKRVIKKENGQIPFSTDRALNDAKKVKTGLYGDKKAVIKKEKGQIPFPTDRALNDADRVKKGLYRDKKQKYIKKDKMMAYSSRPPRTQPVLSLFPFKTPILGIWLANTALLVRMLFCLSLRYGTCAIAMTTAAIPVDELVHPPEPPPWIIDNYCVLICVGVC